MTIDSRAILAIALTAAIGFSWDSAGAERRGPGRTGGRKIGGRQSGARQGGGRQGGGRVMGGRGMGGRNRGGQQSGKDSSKKADMTLIRTLMANRQKIRRQVTNLPTGVATLTETDDARLRSALVQHIKSMYTRMETGRPIRNRDPLFAALFRNAKKVKTKAELTPRGIRVVQTSTDPHTVKLIQAHARTVSLFLKNGFVEVRKLHPIPK